MTTAATAPMHHGKLAIARTRVLVAGSLGVICFVTTVLLAPWQVAMLAAWNLTAIILDRPRHAGAADQDLPCRAADDD